MSICELNVVLDFLEDCKYFKSKYERFLTVCKDIAEDDSRDSRYSNLVALKFVEIKAEMNTLCVHHIINRQDPKSDMETDSDSDSEEDDSEVDDCEEEEEEEMASEHEKELDEKEYPTHCCIDSLFDPFIEAVSSNNSIMKTIQKAEDEMEDLTYRFVGHPSILERNERIKILKDLFLTYDKTKSKVFKTCQSKTIKLVIQLIKTCTDKTGLRGLLGTVYNNLVDKNNSLNEKRQMLRKSATAKIIINFLKNSRPEAFPL